MPVPRHRSFSESLAPGIIGANRVAEPVVGVAAGATEVVDVRGCDRLTPYFATGAGISATAQPCSDEAGTAMPGSAAAALTAGTAVTVNAPFYKIVSTGATMVVARG